MSIPKSNAPSAASAAASSRPAPGPSTPANTSFPSIATPKSHQTPGGHGTFASPAQKGTPRPMGTPSRAGRTIVGGKTMPGSKTFAAKTSAASTDTIGPSSIAGISTPAFTFGTPALNFGSPAINFASPNANGTGMTNTDAFPHPTSSFVGFDSNVGMGISLSSLGINLTGTPMATTASAMGKADAAERRRRLRTVLQTLSTRPGRISREGIERLGRRCGLDIQPGEVDELAMAGKNVMVDIKYEPNQSQAIETLAVAFATASDSMTEHAEKAAAILHSVLAPSTGVAAINATLDKFADNLARLALMDKLSTPGASCFDAVFGIYTSLKRLYEHEKKIAEQFFDTSKDSRRAEKHVMCKKSGRPQMHVRDKVGLSIDYWMDQHLVPHATEDYSRSSTNTSSNTNDSRVSSVLIECESTQSTIYPGISITSDWLSERVEKPSDDVDMTKNENGSATIGNEPVIEWLEPPPLILPPPESSAAQALNDSVAVASAIQSNVRFVARWQPHVPLPLVIASQIYASVGVDISQETTSPITLQQLLFPRHFHSPAIGELLPKSWRISRTVVDRSDRSQEYSLGLYPTRIEAVRRLDNLPFVHPRQLVFILPVLRQYTLLAKLLQNTFAPSGTEQDTSNNASSQITTHTNGTSHVKSDTNSQNSIEAELAALLDESPSSQSPSVQSLDVSLTVTPIPQLTVVFTSAQGPKRVTFNVLLNAEIELVEQNVSNSPGIDGSTIQNDKPVTTKVELALVKALTVCEDLVTWVEWIKSKFLQLE